MVYSLKDHIASIYKNLEKYKYILLPNSPVYVKQTEINNDKVSLYIPQYVGFGQPGSLETKGKGFITAHETLNVKNRDKVQLESYSYKFISKAYNYSIKDIYGSSKDLEFHFRYEKDLVARSGHPKEHLHVIHDNPRYNSGECNFSKFMEIIVSSFFINQECRTVPLWQD